MIISRFSSYTSTSSSTSTTTITSLISSTSTTATTSIDLSNVDVSLPSWLSNVLKANIDSLKSLVQGKLATALSEVAAEWLNNDFAANVASFSYLLNSGIFLSQHPQLASLVTFGRTLLYYFKMKYVEQDANYANYANFFAYLSDRDLLKIYFDGQELALNSQNELSYSNGSNFSVGVTLNGLSIYILGSDSSGHHTLRIESKFPFFFALQNFHSGYLRGSNFEITYSPSRKLEIVEDYTRSEGFAEIDENANIAYLEHRDVSSGSGAPSVARYFIYPILIDDELVSIAETSDESSEQSS